MNNNDKFRAIMRTHWLIAKDQDHTDGSWRRPVDEDAMIAVLREHVQQMLAEACVDGMGMAAGAAVPAVDPGRAERHAARIISTLTNQDTPTG